MTIRRAAVLTLLSLALVLVACSGDDPTSPDPDPSSDGLALVGSRPYDGQPGCLVNQPILLFFDRPPDRTTLEGALSLSRGFVTGMDWLTDLNVVIHHTTWDEGVEVELTVDTSLLDTEGEPLSESRTIGFWTETDEVHLLDHTPATGAAGLARNNPVTLVFSRWMSKTTLAAGVTVSTPDKADHAFSVHDHDDQSYLLVFDPPLPADTEVTVDVGTDCEDTLGAPLAEAASFSYTTDSETVTGAPRILSFEPEIGAVIEADQHYLRIVFDRPVDRSTLGFSLMDINFALASELSFAPHMWSDDGRTLTRLLTTPLPAGVRFKVGIDRFDDIYGNESAAPYLWEATVAGDPELMPVQEFFACRYQGDWWIEGSVVDGGELTEIIIFERLSETEFLRHQAESMSDPATTADRMELTATGVDMLGWLSDPEGLAIVTDFTPPMTWLKTPAVAETWQADIAWTNALSAGDIDWVVTVLPGVEDRVWEPLPAAGAGPGLFPAAKSYTPATYMLLDCRTVVMERHFASFGTPIYTQTDTLVYSPGFGMVERRTHIQDAGSEDERWEELVFRGITLLISVLP